MFDSKFSPYQATANFRIKTEIKELMSSNFAEEQFVGKQYYLMKSVKLYDLKATSLIAVLLTPSSC